MVAYFKRYLNVLLSFLVMILASACSEGCGQAREKDANGKQDRQTDLDDVTAKIAKLDSAGNFITVGDLDNFRPGRPKNEILKALRWRAGFVVAAKCDEKSITAINYTLYADGPESHRSESLYAMFVDDKFVKLINDWPTAQSDRREKTGDYCGWLNGALKSKAVNIDELRKDVKSIKAPPEHIDPGLTAVFLAFRALGLTFAPPPEKDTEKLRKNAPLRDQFNAARLNIGMTESVVEATLKAKPLESGKVDAGDYSIYGSNESFDISDWLCFSHFSNVLVVFREGKAIAISSISAGYDWRERLEKTLFDLPKRAAARGPDEGKQPPQ